MLDFRLRKPSSALNWRYQEVIVTEEYLQAHSSNPNLIELDYAYSPGNKVLDVYYNGQRLTEGGGYAEVDALHIRLDIRGYDEEGNEVPSQLQVGDEVIIKEWFNADSVLYGATGINTRLTTLEIEVHNARKGFPKLVDKINDIDRELSNLLGEGDYEIEYVYDSNNEDVVIENVTGGYELTREFTYNQFGKPVQEVITHGNTVTTRLYEYDQVTGMIARVVSSMVMN